MTKTLCIHHGSNCIDGFAAAWVVHRALGGEVEFAAASYGDELPSQIRGRDILIVDFSYKRPVLEAIAREARSVLVLDHHKSAAEDLAGLPSISDLSWDYWTSEDFHHRATKVASLFDMNRSGAGITWDFFNPGVPRPWFISLVEDRDLWRFADDRSRPFHAAVTSHPLDFALWDDLYDEPEPSEQFGRLFVEGRAILRKHDLDVQTVIRTTRRTMVIGGVRVPVCNCPPWLASDVGHELTKEESAPGMLLAGAMPTKAPWDAIQIRPGIIIPPFSATYYDRDGRRNFSLRSRPEGADVSAVCAKYGGGGHHGAGGFEMPQGWEGDE